eukprot:2512360-Prymnesium_polylepis.1
MVHCLSRLSCAASLPSRSRCVFIRFTSHQQRRARGSTDRHEQARTDTHKPHEPRRTDKTPGPK